MSSATRAGDRPVLAPLTTSRSHVALPSLSALQLTTSPLSLSAHAHAHAQGPEPDAYFSDTLASVGHHHSHALHNTVSFFTSPSPATKTTELPPPHPAYGCGPAPSQSAAFPAYPEHLPLVFAKVPVPPSTSSLFGSTTDSDAPYASEGGYCSPPLSGSGYGSRQGSGSVNGGAGAHGVPRSPSLLSCLFQRDGVAGQGQGQGQGASQPPSNTSSRNGSTSCSSQPTPVTPFSTSPVFAAAAGVVVGGCKPILRRPTGEHEPSTSTSTSASEDNGYFSQRGGLGLTRFDSASSAQALGRADGQKKRCSLTFAVKPCLVSVALAHAHDTARAGPTRSASASSSRCGRRARSPAPDAIPEWEEEAQSQILTPELPVPDMRDETSDDEGYEEDEEGGFTDDEDELGAFAAQASTVRSMRGRGGPGAGRVSVGWNPRFVGAFGAPAGGGANSDAGPSSPRWRGKKDRYYSYCTTDDNAPEPIRGRKISIAARTTDRCSRHVSPPPREPSPDSAPPAARSPSARDMCMRREKARQGGTGCSGVDEASVRGWRSDGAFMGPRSRATVPFPSTLTGVSASASGSGRKGSLPEGNGNGDATCRSILRFAEGSASTAASSRTSLEMGSASPRKRTYQPHQRASLRSPSPSVLDACYVSDVCATASAGSASCGAGDAVRGLEAALRSGGARAVA